MNALAPKQVYELAEALASALHMVCQAVPGGREQLDSITQSRDLYLRLGPYLLNEQERAGFPASDTIHKE